MTSAGRGDKYLYYSTRSDIYKSYLREDQNRCPKVRVYSASLVDGVWGPPASQSV